MSLKDMLKYIIYFLFTLIVLKIIYDLVKSNKNQIEHFRFGRKIKKLARRARRAGRLGRASRGSRGSFEGVIKKVNNKILSMDKIILHNRKSTSDNNTRLRNIENHLQEQNQSDYEERINRLEQQLAEFEND